MTNCHTIYMARILATALVVSLACLSGCATQEPCVSAQHHSAAHDDAPFIPSPSATYVFRQQWKMIRQMSKDFHVDVTVMWMPCGEENSMYYPDENRIVLCTEMAEHPGAAIMFAAHEMGHAVTNNLLSETDENDADEIGALAMIRHEWWNEMLEGAIYYQENPPLEHIPGDPHPATGFRAWEFACLESGGVERSPSDCVSLYDGLKLKWSMRLGIPQ